jgi:hypothetical protein
MIKPLTPAQRTVFRNQLADDKANALHMLGSVVACLTTSGDPVQVDIGRKVEAVFKAAVAAGVAAAEDRARKVH